MKNKIGWCNTTWNPVWGCRNNCPYCYARGLAKRFYDVIAEKEHRWLRGRIYQGEIANRLRHFIPTLLFSHLYKKLPKRPQRIFVGSMSEINHWKDHWMDDVIQRIKYHPQHIFMFLTQYPEVYAKYLFSPNCWYGVTITRNEPIEKAFCIPTKKGIKFLSIEPILEKIDIEHIDDFEPDWIIVGAESGNRKGKVIPKKEWIEDIVDYCERDKIPIYLKDNLKGIYPEEIKEFPKMESIDARSK